MHPRERVLGMARYYIERGEPIPLDLLVEADELGMSLTLLDLPATHTTDTDETAIEGEK